MKGVVVRTVIDTNRLQSEQLRRYLAANSNNYAVLPDFVQMEVLKGDTLASIYKAMRILGKFPNQVLVLKGTKLAWAVKGSKSGLQKRLIDPKQTDRKSVV